MSKRPKRSEVAIEKTWDLSALFPDRNAFLSERDGLLKDADGLVKYKGHLSDDAETLYAALEAYFDLAARLSRLESYSFLKQAADSTDPENQSDAARVSSASAVVRAKLSFFKEELLAIDEPVLKRLIDGKAELADYAPYFKKLATFKPYRLHPEAEKTISALSELLDAPYVIYLRSKLADMPFEDVVDGNGNKQPMSFTLYENSYASSRDTVLRRNAYDSFTKTLAAYKNTFAAVYGTEIAKTRALADMRGYKTATEMLLQQQQVTEQMYDNLLDIIYAELAPHMRRYAALKQKALGLETMTYADLLAPIDTTNPQTTYEESKAVVLDALKIMGPEYQAVIEEGLNGRWVDYADNIGKSTGGFCDSPYGAHSYILLTWTGDIRNILTLAHEFGHAGHFALAQKHQKFANYQPSTYFVEAPSTMNELLLARYLKAHASSAAMRQSVTERLLSTYYHNYVTHLLEGVYQRRVFRRVERGEAVTASMLTQVFNETLAGFWGDAIALDARDGLTWMRQPHYYSGLYSYTYSAGLTIATTVAGQIADEGRPAVGRWLSVLKEGGRLSPLKLAEKAHVDMLNPDTIRRAVAYVGSLVDEMVSASVSERRP